MNMGHDGNMQGQGQGQPGHPGQGGGNHNEEHRKQVLKQQQQRLLLLRHASKCPHDSGRCPVTPHCANMKQLWKHIMTCKDQECKVAHCVSSRYVLSHYSKCKDQACPVCGPVREAIRRNYERSKEVVKLASSNNGGGGGGAGGNMNMNMNMHPNDAAGGDKPKKKRERKGIEEDLNAKKPRANAKGASLGASSSMGGQGGMADAGKLIAAKGGKGGKGNGQLGGHSQLSMVFPPHNNAQYLQQSLIPSAPKKIYPLDPVSCALYNMSNENADLHCKHIHEGMKVTQVRVKDICLPIIDQLFGESHAFSVFGGPGDD